MVDLDTVMEEDLAIPERDLPVTITYRVITSYGYDPETGEMVPVYSDYTITCLKGRVNNMEITAGNGLFGYGDVKWYIRAEEMVDNWTDGIPRMDDQILYETVKYNILRYIESPDGALITIYTRRAEGV